MGFNPTTFVFELLNFLVLLWVLRRLVYQPLRRSLDARRRADEEREARANAALEDASALERKYAEKRGALDELRQQIIVEASERAAEERARIIREAHEDAVGERARVQRLLDAEREAASAWVREMAIEHSTEVAGKMLLQLAPHDVDRILFARLLESLDAALASEGGETDAGEEIDVTFAQPPGEDQRAALRETIGRHFGPHVRFVTREDPALLGGAVCRIGDRVYDGSVAGQLDAFRDNVRAMVQREANSG
jgi:F-type H+-transporting ATPase subunit b